MENNENKYPLVPIKTALAKAERGFILTKGNLPQIRVHNNDPGQEHGEDKGKEKRWQWRPSFRLIIASAFAALIMIALVWWFGKNDKPINAENGDKIITVSVEIYEGMSLVNAKIAPPLIKLNQNQVVAVEVDSQLKRKFYFGKKVVNLTNILTFTIPGKKAVFSPGDRGFVTAFEATKSGPMKFKLDYPEFLTDFITVAKDPEGKPISGPITFSVKLLSKLPETYAPPRQIVRLKGPAGAFFPETIVIKEERTFVLRKRAQEGFAKTEKNILEKVEIYTKHVHGFFQIEQKK